MRWVALFTLGCFVTLTSFAYGRAEQWTPHKTLASYGKPVLLWKKPLALQQAEVLAKVYGVTPENMNDDIFGE